MKGVVTVIVTLDLLNNTMLLSLLTVVPVIDATVYGTVAVLDYI